MAGSCLAPTTTPVSYTHLRAHETNSYLVFRLLLEKKEDHRDPLLSIRRQRQMCIRDSKEALHRLTSWHRRTNGGLLLGADDNPCLLYTSPSPRDELLSRIPSSA